MFRICSLWAETGPWVMLVNHCEVPPLSVGPPAPGQSLCVNESKGQRGPKRRMFTQPQWDWLTPAYWMTGSADWRFTGWFYKHTEARLCSYFVGSEIPSTYLPYIFYFLSFIVSSLALAYMLLCLVLTVPQWNKYKKKAHVVLKKCYLNRENNAFVGDLFQRWMSPHVLP